MDSRTYLFEEYQREQACCLLSLKLAKKIVVRKFIDATQPPEAVRRIRERWLEIFSDSTFYNSCHACQGMCCAKSNFYFPPIELLFTLCYQPDFDFPEPDWPFLKKDFESDLGKIRYPCFFLSKNGCLLKRNKPYPCLLATCRSLRIIADILRIDFYQMALDRLEVEKEYRLWCQRIFDYLKVKSVSENAMTQGYLIYPEGPKVLEILASSSLTR